MKAEKTKPQPTRFGYWLIRQAEKLRDTLPPPPKDWRGWYSEYVGIRFDRVHGPYGYLVLGRRIFTFSRATKLTRTFRW